MLVSLLLFYIYVLENYFFLNENHSINYEKDGNLFEMNLNFMNN